MPIQRLIRSNLRSCEMIDRRGKDIYFLDFSFNLFMQYYLFFFGGGVSENKI